MHAYLREVPCLPGQLLECKGGHDVHGRPAALIQAAPVLVGGLLVARGGESPVQSLCASDTPAPPPQPVGNGLHKHAGSNFAPDQDFRTAALR